MLMDEEYICGPGNTFLTPQTSKVKETKILVFLTYKICDQIFQLWKVLNTKVFNQKICSLTRWSPWSFQVQF